MSIRVCIALFALTSTVGLAQTPPSTRALPDLGSVKAIHITGFEQMTGPDLDIAVCLMEKLKAKGPFTFPSSPDAADAVLTWTSNIPSGFSRHMWGSAPRIDATLAMPSGRVLWTGENKFKKSTTFWGANTNIPCGLANGVVNKLARDMNKRQKPRNRP